MWLKPDLATLSADPLGRYLASACRAQSADTAAIWLWDTSNWTGVAQLPAHTLTGEEQDLKLVVAGRLGPRLACNDRQHACSEPAYSRPNACGRLHRHRLLCLLPTPFHLPLPTAVTQLAFSPDGRFLASASRDRSVALFERQEQGSAGGEAQGPAAVTAPFRRVGCIKAHSRIVWGLHWSPDGRLLGTASRDGKGEPAG